MDAERLDALLIDNGFERSPFDDEHEFRWADGRTAIYVGQRTDDGAYEVATWRPYGTCVYHERGLTFPTAVAFALSEAASTHVTH
jgi:hypothetical protein